MATFAAVLSGKHDYTLYLDVWESALDQANNRSQVSWSLHINKVYYYDNAWNRYHVCNYYVQVNGGDVARATGVDYDFKTTAVNYFSSGSAWVAHSADGTGSATITGHFGGTSALGSATASGTIGLSGLIQGPDAPSGISFVDDSVIKYITWTNNPTAIKPYLGVILDRFVNGVIDKSVSIYTNSYSDTDYIRGYVQYSVRAVNNAGGSGRVFTTIEVGNPVGTMTVPANPATVRCSWTIPTVLNGKTISGYRIQWTKLYPSDSGTTDVSSATSFYDYSIVTDQSISFSVAALIDGSYAPFSNSSNTVKNTPFYPLAPGSVTVTTPIVTGSVVPRTSSVTVNWTPVSGADQHRVNVTPAGPLVTYGDGTATISGMTPGATYTFSVQAHNSYGWGALSGTLSVIAPNVPNAPSITSLTSMVADGVPTIVLSYAVDNSAPANGYSTITDTQYRVTWPGHTLVDWSSVTASPMEIATSVIPGTSYLVGVKSINAVGESVVTSSTIVPIGGRIMVNDSGTWTPKYIKAGSSFDVNAQVRVLGDNGRWGYTGV